MVFLWSELYLENQIVWSHRDYTKNNYKMLQKLYLAVVFDAQIWQILCFLHFFFISWQWEISMNTGNGKVWKYSSNMPVKIIQWPLYKLSISKMLRLFVLWFSIGILILMFAQRKLLLNSNENRIICYALDWVSVYLCNYSATVWIEWQLRIFLLNNVVWQWPQEHLL